MVVRRANLSPPEQFLCLDLRRERRATMTKPETTTTDVLHDEKNDMALMEAVESTKGNSTGFEHDAALGTEQEKTMSLGAAFKYYRKAVIWSVVICK